MKKLRITVEGKAYDVTVEVLDKGQISNSKVSEVTEPNKPQAAASTGGSVPSPLAGKIVSIEASAGQAVKEGDELITMEAMKMNTHVFAPHDGTISKILVSEGDAVEEGQPLIEMS
ncbi:MAG: biotin/lipoyl-containing protein [Verrucomicrobiota bacterium]